MGIEVTSLGIQIHGGMGFIEEAGAAQHWRDSRITTIYEGTTGIQANDLVFRKLMRDGGSTMKRVLGEVADTTKALGDSEHAQLRAIGQRLGATLHTWGGATEYLVGKVKSDPAAALAAAVPYLHLAITVCGGWQLGRGALAAARRLRAGEGGSGFFAGKIATARFYAEQVLPLATAYGESVQTAGVALASITDEMF
jgi:hypothetical protein